MVFDRLRLPTPISWGNVKSIRLSYTMDLKVTITKSGSPRRKERKEVYRDAENLVFFRPAEATDLPLICRLEAEGYPADEKASPEVLKWRQKQAGNLFLVGVQSRKGRDQLLGFVCGTQTAATSLTHESMAQHDEEGATLCIHSVCVDHAQRRQGIAKRMLQAYILFVQQTTPQVQTVRLISKKSLLPLYEGVGFQLLGPSNVVHGEDQWWEMEYRLPAAAQG